MANNQQLLLGEGAGSAPAVFVEDVFSTYLYTGTGSTQTITNNIDLSTKGGLVWVKPRSAVGSNVVRDSARGLTNALVTEETYAQGSGYVTTFTSTGYTDGTMITNGVTFVSWTFREQPKFFDIVTYTGDGAVRTLAHNLGSVPGLVLIKCTSLGGTDWMVFHRSTPTGYFYLNSTAALSTAGAATFFGNGSSVVAPDATSIYLGSGDSQINQTSATYVAYLYAHDAGGFGLAGTDNVISCGSFTTDGSGNATVNLGYEPQWLMTKVTSTTGGWRVFDTMRGWSGGIDALLVPNTNGAEYVAEDYGNPTATGMNITNHGASITWIYIAIRRGPMKVPTVGTSVYNGIVRTGTSATATISGAGFPPDFALTKHKDGAGNSYSLTDRLRGAGSSTSVLNTNNTNAEQSGTTDVTSFTMDGAVVGTNGTVNYTGYSYINWFFKRAPGFFDEVCYTGTGVATTQAHNLGAVPEMMIVKRRNATNNWAVYTAALGNTNRIFINQTGASAADSTLWNNTTPTNSVFTIGTAFATNNSGDTYVAYLFATCAGVSKVGSYTGNGSSQTIACGFTAGSRFVLIKRTDSTGDWYVWDSARGIIAGNDPHLSLNTTAAEVTTDDSVDTDNSGFIVNQDAATNVNVTSATYIFLAIA